MRLKDRITYSYSGGALLYTLLIVLLLSIITLALLTLTSYQQTIFNTDRINVDLNRHISQGLEILQSGQPEKYDYRQVIAIGSEGDTLVLQRKKWGVYDCITASAYHLTNLQPIKRNKIALCGYPSDSIGKSALFLADYGQPLTLTGNCSIKGNVYVPARGIVPGYIATIGFNGNELYNGYKKNSTRYLPFPQVELLDFHTSYTQTNGAPPLRSVPKQLSVSFEENPVLIESKILDLRFTELTGNIVLKADSIIQIGEHSKLQDILLFAPVIQIEDGFNGCLQAFSTKRVSLGKNVNLNYPSTLTCCRQANAVSSTPEGIFIGEHCNVAGLLLTWNNFQYSQGRPEINIGKSTLIRGRIFSDGSVNLKGNVWGNITTISFNLKTPSAIYENFLMDATIDVTKLPEAQIATILWPVSNKTEIVKWLQ
jgi:hypothetical protein